MNKQKPINIFKLTEDVRKKDYPWLDRDFKKGEIVYEYFGPTYGVISFRGTACTQKPHEIPFFELPNKYLRKHDN